MKLFRLCSLDTLLALLLVDGAWWSVMFLGQYLPYLVYYVGRTIREGQSLDLRGMLLLIFGLLVFLRFKASCLLLIAVFKNQVNEHCQLLKIWYWVSISLDATLLGAQVVTFFIASAADAPAKGFFESTSIYVSAFFILRVTFWSFAQPMVLELGQTENTLFPIKGCRGVFSYLGSSTKSLVKILLAWEILWNGISLVSILVAILRSLLQARRMLFPILIPGSAFGLFPLVTTPWIFIVCGLQMIGVEKGWKAFLKVLLVVYIVGVVGNALQLASDLYSSFSYLDLIAMLCHSVVGVGQFALKLILIVSMIKYFRESGNTEDVEKENEVFMQPLLPTEILAGKDVAKE